MEQVFTPTQAWEHFWQHIRPAIWDGLTASQRDQLGKANRAYHKKLPAPLGVRRIERLLDEHAKGRYIFRHGETIVLYNDTPAAP